MIEYYVNVDSPGGADLSFKTTVDRELAPNAIIVDRRGRSYIVDTAEMVPDASDPLRPGLLFGKANARPTNAVA